LEILCVTPLGLKSWQDLEALLLCFVVTGRAVFLRWRPNQADEGGLRGSFSSYEPV